PRAPPPFPTRRSSDLTTADKPMLGFSAASAASQRALEAQFDAKLNRDDLREWMRRLSARPHHLGSAYDKQNAELIASLFKSWGRSEEHTSELQSRSDL